MDPSAAGSGASRRRAEQFLGVAEKLLVARDFEGCKEFSSQALAADRNTPGAEDLNAVASVLLAAERRRLPNGNPDPYAILGLDSTNPASRRPDAVYSHFSRLSLLLSRSRPDPSFSLAFTNAAGHVAEAWRFLSDSVRKSALDADLDAAAAAAANAARAYHSPAPNRPQSQSPLPVRPNPPFATLSPQPTPSPAAPFPWSTPSPAAPPLRGTPPPVAPYPRSTPPRAAVAPRQTPPPAASPPRPQPPPAASPPRPQPPPVAVAPRQTPLSASPAPRPTPPPAASPPRPQQAASPSRSTPLPVGPQTQPTPPTPAPQTSAVPLAASGTPPLSTFWTACTACRHIHQYDRLYEARKLLCPSCRQTFVAEAMAEPPPIVPGTDMYFCTWGFFPVGFPGCPGFDRLVNSQPQGPDQQNAPWLMGTAGAKGNAADTGVNGNAPDNVENVVLVSAAAEIPVEEVPATTPPAKPMRVKVGAKKRGRPKGS
ncbi:hypothetical protein QOZ80_6AG0538020 [Eleusine coracana subsp. coracana]|nr:hypothetical protein QOZ80_6AG0538020 [Eleusine coracana subsp. coracana]